MRGLGCESVAFKGEPVTQRVGKILTSAESRSSVAMARHGARNAVITIVGASQIVGYL